MPDGLKMDELGTILRETREARSLSLEEVAQVTRIRVRYLEALEEGRYDVLPTPVHVRGFLRNYAQYLKLDPEPLISRYNASRRMVQDIPLAKQIRPELEKTPPQPPETLDDELHPDPVFFRPLGSSLRTPAWLSGEIVIAGFAALVLLAFIVWAVGRFVVPAFSGDEAAETPAAVEITVTRPAFTPVAVASPTQAAATVIALPTTPPIFTNIQLEITVLERAWLKIEVDGEIVQEGMTQPGDLFSFDGTELVKLSTGNAGGLEVTLNGQKLGSLGGRNEVVEKIWSLTGELQPTPAPTAAPTQPPPSPTEPLPTDEATGEAPAETPEPAPTP